MKIITCVVLTVLTGTLYGCCAAIFYPSLSVAVYDESTGARICGFKVSAADDMQIFKAESIQTEQCEDKDTNVALSYTGTFKVTVEKPGYNLWTKEVKVTQASEQCSGHIEYIKVTLKKN
ncbi:MAG: PEGA domain-containing protein [Moraxellaceae bacterium]|nr:MAG: PEGA domain-containing protein [Moraxellaceae bacterium]